MQRNVLMFVFFMLIFYSLISETIEVNLDGSGDFESIQEGINDSGNGDIVLVYPGRYYENIDFMGKTISVVSLEWQTGERHYIHETIIDGNQESCCVKVTNEEGNGTQIQGFTITNGIGYLESNDKRYGGGIYINNSDIIIVNCIIEYNEARDGGGIGVTYSNLFIAGVTIRYNKAFHFGGGIGSGNMMSAIQFSLENRSNIYCNYSPYGKDICNGYDPGYIIDIYADTLTTWEPLGYDIIQHDSYIESYDDMILDFNAAKIERIEADLYISPDGDDTNSGLSPNDPMLSLDTALRYIKADSLNRRTINLADGTYYPMSNDEMYPITIRDYVSIAGAGKDETIIDLEGETGFIFNKGGKTGYTVSDLTVVNGGNGAWNKIVDISHRDSPSSHITFENVGFDNCVNSAFTIINIAPKMSYINCSFTNITTGQFITAIPAPEDSQMDLINCYFHNSEGDVFTSSQTSDLRVNVAGCEFSDLHYINDTGQPLAPAYISYSSYQNVQSYIVNSTFTTNSMEGPYIASAPIAAASGSDLTLINSIIWGNDLTHSLVLYNAASAEFTAHHNIFEDGYSGIYGSAGTMNWDNNTNFDLDPLFFAPEVGDYRLSEGSPAIDAGTLDLPPGITLPETDISGSIRVYGDQIDIGAYEWNPWSSPAGNNEIEKVNPDLICIPNPAYSDFTRTGELQIYWTNHERLFIESAELEIYNIKGQKVESYHLSQDQSASSIATTWDFCNKYGTPVSSGIYFIRLKVNGSFNAQAKITVIR